MSAEQMVELLRGHRDHLDRLGVAALFVFGSVARGEARPESDIDVLVEFNGPATFDGYAQLKFYLEDLLQAPIDLVTRDAVRPELKAAIEQDARRIA
jgi:predicted nucleotidyltransferase